jgi:hypothetical protein
MIENKVKGTIKSVSETVQVTDKFKKRAFVITTDDMYPQVLEIECVQDKTDLLNTVKVGEFVEVSINLRGREYAKKDGSIGYFNSINAWRIEAAAAEIAGVSAPVAGADDLPF